MTRIELRIDKAGDDYVVRALCPDDPQWQPQACALRLGQTFRYPLPPLAEAQLWNATVYAALCDGPDDRELRKLHRTILLSDPKAADIERFGGWLYATLLGPLWSDIKQRYPAGDLQFDVACATAASDLEGYPWEMLFIDNLPSIANAERLISFSRLVARRPVDGQVEPAAIKAELRLPLRVLFIVGEMDEVLRPGAEYLGMLRMLDSAAAPAKAPPTTLIVHPLVNASAEQIQAAVESFMPQIVHIVAHGERDNGNTVIRLTKLVPGQPATPDPCSAQRLLELLKGTQRHTPPPVLAVINACHSADQLEPGDPRSFAADLVRGGLPAAVGMAGEVASAACRLFTKAMYRALASQRSVAQAVADGQFTARLHYEKYNSSTEWARPALFVAQRATIEFAVDESQMLLLQAARKFRGRPAPVFDRYRALDSYQRFIDDMAGGAVRLLAFEQAVNEPALEIGGEKLGFQMGKSHLLRDLASHALLSGYLPCLLSSTAAHRPEPNLLRCALRIARVMDDMRASFDIPRRRTSAAFRRALRALNRNVEQVEALSEEAFEAARDEVNEALKNNIGVGANGVEIGSIKDAIARDATDLLSDVRARCSCARGVIVLLDDVHLYDGYYALLLECINEYGLATQDPPVPVVIAYSSKQGHGAALRNALRDRAANVAGRADNVPLDPFAADAEGRLAYSQYLMSVGVMPARGDENVKNRNLIFKWIHEDIKGAPSLLPLTHRYVKQGMDLGVLVPVDEEAIFLQLAGRP